MHLQQTKRASAETGGPQYYFHSLSNHVRTFLRSEGAVPVALVTPYGATKSHFFAVSKDHKLDNSLKVVPGKVGHDRIQQGSAQESIGEAIRRWYKLPDGQFERIDIEIEIFDDDAFYLRPVVCKYANSNKVRKIDKVERPLTFTLDYMSPFWRRQLEKLHSTEPALVEWSIREISRVMRDHHPATRLAHIQEPDLLRGSGPLHHLGLILGGYVGRGYDCISKFRFLSFPEYNVPVEIKRNSSGFQYQQKKYGKDELSRAIVLCAIHNHSSVPPNIDVIEFQAFQKYGIDTLSIDLP